jgi:hypothetical protein
MHNSDLRSLDIMESVRPVWSGLVAAQDAVPLGERTILHAGPPLADAIMAKAVFNSTTMAVLFEGWASDVEQAHAMILAEEVKLLPAQSLGVVVPLASVLSPSMLVHVVEDENNTHLKAFSTINGGMQHALRLGLSNDSVLEHLRWLNGEFGAVLAKAISGAGIPLLPIADHGLGHGDDCHGRTIAATAELLEQLATRLATLDGGAAATAYIAASFPFFLNLWMAATKCILLAANGIEGSSLITSIGGNGIDFGMQVAGQPGRWFTVPAAAPAAIYNPGLSEINGLGAIGDSVVVDAFGLGAMALVFAPEQQKGLEPVLPDDALQLPQRLLGRAHTGFTQTGALFGTAARQIVDLQTSPLVALGVIDIDGEKGRVGGGIYRPPLELFSHACRALDR